MAAALGGDGGKYYMNMYVNSMSYETCAQGPNAVADFSHKIFRVESHVCMSTPTSTATGSESKPNGLPLLGLSAGAFGLGLFIASRQIRKARLGICPPTTPRRRLKNLK
jgi:hypothetical protein